MQDENNQTGQEPTSLPGLPAELSDKFQTTEQLGKAYLELQKNLSESVRLKKGANFDEYAEFSKKVLGINDNSEFDLDDRLSPTVKEAVKKVAKSRGLHPKALKETLDAYNEASAQDAKQLAESKHKEWDEEFNKSYNPTEANKSLVKGIEAMGYTEEKMAEELGVLSKHPLIRKMLLKLGGTEPEPSVGTHETIPKEVSENSKLQEEYHNLRKAILVEENPEKRKQMNDRLLEIAAVIH